MTISIFPNLAEDIDVVEEFSMKLYNPLSVAIFTLSIQQQSSADFLEVASPEETAPPVFSGKYEGSSFNASVGINVSMPVVENGPTGTATLNSFSLLDYKVDCSGYEAKKVGNYIEVSGTPFNVFTDQVYEFLMPDLSVKKLNPNTTEEFVSLVKWVPPSTKVKIISHQFSVIVNYTEDGVSRSAILTLVMPQTIRWNLTNGVNAFRAVLAKSKRV